MEFFIINNMPNSSVKNFTFSISPSAAAKLNFFCFNNIIFFVYYCMKNMMFKISSLTILQNSTPLTIFSIHLILETIYKYHFIWTTKKRHPLAQILLVNLFRMQIVHYNHTYRTYTLMINNHEIF